VLQAVINKAAAKQMSLARSVVSNGDTVSF
jgi:hypothetical protein